MGPKVVFSISSAYQTRYPALAFGYALITGCQPVKDLGGFDQYKRKLLRKMRRRETLVEIAKRIDLYDRFFQSFGFECPLPKHLKRTINSGFPKYNLMVDAHFIAEMCAGILVAVTDFDRFEGSLILDVAKEGETCRGMGNREFRTREREIVFRDEKDIVCVLCQGADEKTRVKDDTQNVFFYAYAVPGVAGEPLKEGLTIAAETISQFGGGKVETIDVFA
jgi:DNA/RNA-binding domain of Phe-tRNA-synthetase-like protein